MPRNYSHRVHYPIFMASDCTTISETETNLNRTELLRNTPKHSNIQLNEETQISESESPRRNQARKTKDMSNDLQSPVYELRTNSTDDYFICKRKRRMSRSKRSAKSKLPNKRFHSANQDYQPSSSEEEFVQRRRKRSRKGVKIQSETNITNSETQNIQPSSYTMQKHNISKVKPVQNNIRHKQQPHSFKKTASTPQKPKTQILPPKNLPTSHHHQAIYSMGNTGINTQAMPLQLPSAGQFTGRNTAIPMVINVTPFSNNPMVAFTPANNITPINQFNPNVMNYLLPESNMGLQPHPQITEYKQTSPPNSNQTTTPTVLTSQDCIPNKNNNENTQTLQQSNNSNVKKTHNCVNNNTNNDQCLNGNENNPTLLTSDSKISVETNSKRPVIDISSRNFMENASTNNSECPEVVYVNTKQAEIKEKKKERHDIQMDNREIEEKRATDAIAKYVEEYDKGKSENKEISNAPVSLSDERIMVDVLRKCLKNMEKNKAFRDSLSGDNSSVDDENRGNCTSNNNNREYKVEYNTNNNADCRNGKCKPPKTLLDSLIGHPKPINDPKEALRSKPIGTAFEQAAFPSFAAALLSTQPKKRKPKIRRENMIDTITTRREVSAEKAELDYSNPARAQLRRQVQCIIDQRRYELVKNSDTESPDSDMDAITRCQVATAASDMRIGFCFRYGCKRVRKSEEDLRNEYERAQRQLIRDENNKMCSANAQYQRMAQTFAAVPMKECTDTPAYSMVNGLTTGAVSEGACKNFNACNANCDPVCMQSGDMDFDNGMDNLTPSCPDCAEDTRVEKEACIAQPSPMLLGYLTNPAGGSQKAPQTQYFNGIPLPAINPDQVDGPTGIDDIAYTMRDVMFPKPPRKKTNVKDYKCKTLRPSCLSSDDDCLLNDEELIGKYAGGRCKDPRYKIVKKNPPRCKVNSICNKNTFTCSPEVDEKKNAAIKPCPEGKVAKKITKKKLTKNIKPTAMGAKLERKTSKKALKKDEEITCDAVKSEKKKNVKDNCIVM